MPKMGESIVEATILKWHKKVGDHIAQDETLLDIATDKVDSEVPSFVEGTVNEILYNVNDVVAVGSVIARIATAAVEPQPIHQPIVQPPQEFTNPKASPPQFVPQQIVSDTSHPYTENLPYVPQNTTPGNAPNNNSFFSPVVLNIANSEGISLSELEKITGTGEDGRVSKKDVLQYIPQNPPQARSTVNNHFFSPLVLNIANSEGLSLTELERISGTGADGRVSKKDVLQYVADKKLGKLPSFNATAPQATSAPQPVAVEAVPQPIYVEPLPIQAAFTAPLPQPILLKEPIAEPILKQAAFTAPLTQPILMKEPIAEPVVVAPIVKEVVAAMPIIPEPAVAVIPEPIIVVPEPIALAEIPEIIEPKIIPKPEQIPEPVAVAEVPIIKEPTIEPQPVTIPKPILEAVKITAPINAAIPATAATMVAPQQSIATSIPQTTVQPVQQSVFVPIPIYTENIPLTTLAEGITGKFANPTSALPTGNTEIIEMDRMRKLIAKHMVNSVQTSPHVTSFVEADVTNMVLWRNRVKDDFEKREGTKITFTPIFIECLVKVMQRFPLINSSIDGDTIVVKKDFNIGMATALPSGNLIVPVIKSAEKLNIVGLSMAVNNLANAARNSTLKPEDTSGGTFTFTNVGTFGSLMGTPIINQPQVAILAVGVIKKRPVVIESADGDTIGIRHMMYLSLSYDHRVIDGSIGASFLTAVAKEFEHWDVNRTWYQYT